jgi:DNA primase
MISKEDIDKIFEATRIEEVISDFITLKKRGVNLLGLCPFHNEKTPSFTVSPSKGIFKCFGCGKAGNAVNFLMEHEKISYPEALRYLANKYHIEIIEENSDFNAEDFQRNNEKESLYLINSFAQKYFSAVLFDSQEGVLMALSYFKERGFNENIIRKFQLGYSQDKGNAFSKEALNNGYLAEYLLKSGLVIEKDEELIDRFRGRVIFPIHNITGRVIAFGGRILSNDKTKSKYINSPETIIYHKGNILYGLYFAKKSIIENNNCYLVEGYTDVISLHQAGIENVVASSGTSLTVEQIKLIHRYSENITILYDGDEAGIKASFRGIDMILEEGMNVKIVLFENQEDPDSFARKNSSSVVKEYIKNNAKDFIKFKTGLLLKDAQNDPIKKINLIKEIVGSIALVPDAITRLVYVHECSELLNMAEQVIMNELNKLLRNKVLKNKGANTETEQIPEEALKIESQFDKNIINDFEAKNECHEQNIIRFLVSYGNKDMFFDEKDENGHDITKTYKVAAFIISDLNNDNLVLKNPNYQAIFNEFVENMKNGIIPDEKYFINHHDSNIASLVSNIIYNPYNLSVNWSKKHKVVINTEDININEAVIDLLNSFKLNRVEEMRDKLLKEIQEDTEQKNTGYLLQELLKLEQIKMAIASPLTRIILK